MFTWPKLIKKPKGKHVLILAPHMDDEIIGYQIQHLESKPINWQSAFAS